MEVKKIYLYSLFAFGPDQICGQKSSATSVEMKAFCGEIFKNNLHLQINCIKIQFPACYTRFGPHDHVT